MNNPEDRTFLDAKQWNPNIGKTYYEIHPKDEKQYRTYYIRWNPFVNALRSFPSNWITGVPPAEMEPMNPLLLRQINTIPQFQQF